MLETRRGAPKKYSDVAINTIRKIKFLFNLTLRAAQGLFESLFQLLNVNLPIPSYSTLSIGLHKLAVELNSPDLNESTSFVIDSSSLKVYGEGEWKVKTHGYSKRRTWRKFHVAINVDDQMIHAVTLTTNDFKDNEIFEETISQITAPIS
ncbi:MAG TPA: transposase, partial [Candidatus Berkiella sp.]|nr:transposase [Candidatus Berkiella sp.]